MKKIVLTTLFLVLSAWSISCLAGYFEVRDYTTSSYGYDSRISDLSYNAHYIFSPSKEEHREITYRAPNNFHDGTLGEVEVTKNWNVVGRWYAERANLWHESLDTEGVSSISLNVITTHYFNQSDIAIFINGERIDNNQMPDINWVPTSGEDILVEIYNAEDI